MVVEVSQEKGGVFGCNFVVWRTLLSGDFTLSEAVNGESEARSLPLMI